MFSAEAKKQISTILKRYPIKASALLPLLNLAQEEEGSVSEDSMREIAKLLDLTPPKVYEVATFYTMLNLKPIGRFHLQVCKSLMCALGGSETLLQWIYKELGIKPGETTQDGMFTLSTVECLASCGTAPMMQVNNDYFERLTHEKVRQIFEDLRTAGKCLLATGPFRWPEPVGLMTAFERVLLKNMDMPGYSGSLKDYEGAGGYKAIQAVLGKMKPGDLIDIVKRSGLRGRGGAGFPTGVKWGFIPKDSPGSKYLCCNADESEPGTFKDRQLIERDPHQMLEGVILGCYAIGAKVSYIYIRGEFILGAKILEKALAEAYKAGYLGMNILGSGFDLDVYVHRGAGAYICGEETALLESLEGKRGKPRTKPPFPAISGLYGKPTVINNVETLSNIPHIVNRGPEWFMSIGSPPKSPGTRIFSLSGHIARPGNYEVPMGITIREMLEDCGGGMRDGKKLKAIIPGGASAAFLSL